MKPETRGRGIDKVNVQSVVSGIDECVVAVDLNYKETIAGVVPTLLGDSAGSIVTLKEVATLGKFGQDAAKSFQLRSTRTAGLGAGVIVGVFWSVLSVIRSGKTALYRSLGVSYWEAYVVRTIEQGLPLLFGTLSGAASAMLLTGVVLEAPLDTQVTFDLVSRHAAAALLLAPALMCASAPLQPRTLRTLKHR